MSDSTRGLRVRWLVVLMLLGALLPGGPAAAASAPVYTVRDLGVISAPLTDALQADQTCAAAGLVTGYVFNLNDAGVVAGSVPGSNLFPVAATISANSVTKLKSGKNGGLASAINAAGVVAGDVYNSPIASPCGFSLDTSPVEWVKGALKKLPLPKGDDTGMAFDINASGEIAGHGGTAADPSVFHGVLWKNGKIARVDQSACSGGSANSGFASINDAGEIAGSSCGQGAWWSAEGKLTALKPLAGSDSSVALSIAPDGSVVGFSLRSADQRTLPTLWTKGKATALPLPKGAKKGIAMKTNGAVVFGTIDGAPAVWFKGKPAILADHVATKLGGTISIGGGINASGQIACAAKIGNEVHTILLTPKN